MKSIQQREHIELLMKESLARGNKAVVIQCVYEKYMEHMADDTFAELLVLLDDYCISWVKKRLWSTGCYSDENVHTSLQEARIAVWEAVMKDVERNDKKDHFLAYAFGIYKKKTFTVIRNTLRLRFRMKSESFSTPVGNEGKTLEDCLPPVQPDFGEKDEIRNMYDNIFRIYCISFLTSEAFPPSILALYYARVLPHLLDEIPESKATSAKWAFERMGNESIWGLKQDSELTIRKSVDKQLAWGDSFLHKLNEEICIGGETLLLRDIIYTSVYNKRKIEDWADYMHKKTMKVAADLIFENKELLDILKEYIPQKDVLYRFIKEGEKCR